MGTEIFGSSKFKDCYFSGCFDSIILRKESLVGETEGVRFSNCDLSDLKIKDVHFYFADVFLKSKLPLEELILLDNRKNLLIERSEEELRNQNADLTELKILFSRNILDKQERVILSKHFLQSFLKTDIQREAFERIIQGRKIT